ncbi:uncharacterized protein A1O9_04179 [Exophiala aquamarina CBS 119918]|uniref:Major facilitator superfamily (MFS) profile domain-containing protein n=1 Tax=Exophiala aquamarina CBS 119918 TaxID=1182545 RepID=A0A072PUY6_9EURO|nr:uncharacterized protein A1O9_04179 [Exophiala aquamarina CBS 119918]KEF59335.1 hypothetical protein A1O9_04179 [Exophiala aquamarina CBS 119918]
MSLLLAIDPLLFALVPVIGIVYSWLTACYVDKSTLGSAAILGVFEDRGITKGEYNHLETFFRVGFLVAQWPGYYTMQKLSLGKLVAVLVSSWGLIVLLHCVATRYAGVLVVRIALGAAQSVVVRAMERTMGMFFVRKEHNFFIQFSGSLLRPGKATVVAAFVSHGLLWSNGLDEHSAESHL